MVRVVYCETDDIPPGNPCSSCSVTPATFEVKLNFTGPYTDSICSIAVCEALEAEWHPHPQDGIGGGACTFTNVSPWNCIGNTASQVRINDSAGTLTIDFIWPLTNAVYRGTIGPSGSNCNFSGTLSLFSGTVGQSGCEFNFAPIPFNTVDIRPATSAAAFIPTI